MDGPGTPSNPFIPLDFPSPGRVSGPACVAHASGRPPSNQRFGPADDRFRLGDGAPVFRFRCGFSGPGVACLPRKPCQLYGLLKSFGNLDAFPFQAI